MATKKDTVDAPEVKPEVPKHRTGHSAAFSTKAEYQAFLDRIKESDLARWERMHKELEAALNDF